MKLFTVREGAFKGIEFAKQEKIEVVGIPFGEALTNGVERFEKGSILHLDDADVVPDQDWFRLVTEQRSNDKRALVKVETAAGVGGSVRLAARPLVERFCKKSGRVRQEIMPIEQATGVTLISHTFLQEEGKPKTNEEFLVRLDPGASFRIVRTGELEGGPPEILVQWNGYWDHKSVAALCDRMDNPDMPWPTQEELLKPWAFKVRPGFERHSWHFIDTSSTP